MHEGERKANRGAYDLLPGHANARQEAGSATQAFSVRIYGPIDGGIT